MRPRGRGGGRPQRRAADPPNLAALLTDMYEKLWLSSREIGLILRMPERRVRERLREYGIRRRPRGRCTREERVSVDEATLTKLYVGAGLTAADVAERLGTSHRIVLRSAHDLGLPVHQGSAGEIELIDALYADPAVAQTLTRHTITAVPAGAPIWQRFPQPVALTKGLVTDLYDDCGLGLHHIELLTGQPSGTVRHFMNRTGIPRRHPGGRTPFLRRWRTTSAPATRAPD